MAHLSSILSTLKHMAHRHHRERGCIGARMVIIAAPGLIYVLFGPGLAAIWMVDE